MAPLVLALPTYYAGDTWKGFSVVDVLLDGVVPTVPAASCKMQFRTDMGKLGFEYNTVPDSCKGLIKIDDANTWDCTVDPAILPLDASEIWYWDFEVTDANGHVETILKGRLRIKDDITK